MTVVTVPNEPSISVKGGGILDELSEELVCYALNTGQCHSSAVHSNTKSPVRKTE